MKDRKASCFIKNVKYLCRVNKVSLQELSKYIGRNPNYLSRTHEVIQLYDAMAIAEYFGVALDDLVYKDCEEFVIRSQIRNKEIELQILKAELNRNRNRKV